MRLSSKGSQPFGLVLLMFVLTLPTGAQVDEFLPEVDIYHKLSSDVRFIFQAKETREGGQPTQAEIGPSIEFYMKPLVKLNRLTGYDLDDSKLRSIVPSIGYRYLPSPDAPPVNRIEPLLTLHIPAPAALLLSNRSRGDLDWQSGKFYWRYRNLTQFEKRLTIHSYRPAPYASVEFFYQSRYSKWSDTAIYAGSLFPLSKHVGFNFYYEHQNNTGKSPNQQLNQLGLILNLLF